MESVSICHALEDRERAQELAQFIQLNLGYEVSTTDAIVTAGQDILSATEQALSASVAIVLLSPASIPAPLKQRSEWQEVFTYLPARYGSALAFVLLAECPFPPLLLRRAHFFDGSRDFLACKRQLKRWLISNARSHKRRSCAQTAVDPEALEEIRKRIVDQPGSTEADAALAQAIAQEAAGDFEGSFTIWCGGRHLAMILGELGASLPLPLHGPVERNRDAIAEHCAAHRCLFIFQNADSAVREHLCFGGRSSVLFANGAMREAPAAIDRVTAANVSDAIEQCLELLRTDAEAGGERAAEIVRKLSDYGRLAEADLVLEAMQKAGCMSRELWITREREWIRHAWTGAPIPGPIVDFRGEQEPLWP